MKSIETSTPASRNAQPPRAGDFRLYLQQELVARCRANPRYSLRAFARTLGAAPSFVSHLLRGQRAVTLAAIKKFGAKLGLSPRELEAFAAFHQKKPRVGAAAEPAAPLVDGVAVDYRQLTLNQFQMISDWYHYAILELVAVDGFEPEPRWIARALGITVPEVNVATERLFRLEMLERGPAGQWINASGNNTTVGNPFTAVAFRKLQKQVLEQAITALEEIPMEQRHQSSLTLAMDSSLLPELNEAVRAFKKRVAELHERSAKRDQVYHASVSFYPVVKTKGPHHESK